VNVRHNWKPFCAALTNSISFCNDSIKCDSAWNDPICPTKSGVSIVQKNVVTFNVILTITNALKLCKKLLIHVYMATHSPDIPIHGHSLSWYTYIWSLTLLVHIYMVTHSPGLVKHFDFWAYLMKVIPEARRAHSIWYLRFYFFTYF
jgi:hypothetical protein